MFYPKMAEIPTTRDILDKFKGYDHNLRIGDGEFFDMKNLTSDHYPVLSPRKKRGTYLTTKDANGMCSNTQFCYVDGSTFYIGSNPHDLQLTNEPKELVSMGTRVVVMPDQKFINTINPSDTGTMKKGIHELPHKAQGSEKDICISVQILDKDGKAYTAEKLLGVYTSTSDLPKATNKNKGTLAIVTATEGGQTKAYWYVSRYGEYVNGSYGYYWERYLYYDADKLTYKVKISLVEGDADFWQTELEKIKTDMGTKKVYINGLTSSLNDKAVKITIEDSSIVFKASDIKDAPDDGSEPDPFILDLLFGRTTNIYEPYNLENKMLSIKAPYNAKSEIPTMDYIIESGNRLWGCRYGENGTEDDGQETAFVNEIYASVLGDLQDWTTKNGVSTDSYAASVGTSGKFTGAINFGGKPIFFKEDCMHRVFGDIPSNFQVQMLPCKGVQEGCSKSLAIVNDVLYYKSRTGICAYDGSLPVEISLNFGDKQYKNAVGGALGNKYYVSMQDEKDEWSLFVYDTIKRMWHKEDDLQATQFCNHKGELYYIDYADRYIHSINGTGVEETAPIPWMAETGILGANTPDNKYVSRLDLRMSVARGSEVAVYIEYDSMGDWEKIADIEGLALNTFTIPVQPRRCDHFRLKFVGEGDAKIFSISKVLEESE